MSSSGGERKSVEAVAQRESREPHGGRRGRRRPAVVPISMPQIPESLFPITSQSDLEAKAQSLLRQHTPADASAPSVPPGRETPKG
jgi:hypothetical protein